MVLRTIGQVLVFVGIVVILFTAYQLWGTGLFEARSQDHLRTELEHVIARRALDAPEPAPSPAGTLPALAPLVLPPPTGAPIGILRIPSIGLDQVVVEGVGTAQLRSGPGHYPETPLPGEAGNVAIAGHRTTYAHPFYDLSDVRPGAAIDISTTQGQFVYRATGTIVVSPSDVAVLDPIGRATLTLTTCNPPYSAASRLVLRATLSASRLSTATGRRAQQNPSRPAGKQVAGSKGADKAAGSVAGKQVAGKQVAGSTGADKAAGSVAASGSADASGTGLGATTDTGAWVSTVGWGALVAALGIGLPLLARRFTRRWPVFVAGALAFLVVLFLFFSAVSALLPASL